MQTVQVPIEVWTGAGGIFNLFDLPCVLGIGRTARKRCFALNVPRRVSSPWESDTLWFRCCRCCGKTHWLQHMVHSSTATWTFLESHQKAPQPISDNRMRWTQKPFDGSSHARSPMALYRFDTLKTGFETEMLYYSTQVWCSHAGWKVALERPGSKLASLKP